MTSRELSPTMPLYLQVSEVGRAVRLNGFKEGNWKTVPLYFPLLSSSLNFLRYRSLILGELFFLGSVKGRDLA